MNKEKTLVAEIAGMDIFHQTLNGQSCWSVENDEHPMATLIGSFDGAVKEAAKAAGILKIADRN